MRQAVGGGAGSRQHPWAWWAWAVGLAVAASGTTNPLLLCLIGTVAVTVVMLRRGEAPWARSLRAYFLLAGFIVVMRLSFQVLMGVSIGSTVLFTLPEVPLPDWAAGIRLGGAVTAESLLYGGYDALRIAVMLICLGAANSLANPRQALRSVPAALYEASVAVVIALAVAPQLIESAARVRQARRLRGGSMRGPRAVLSILMPVLADAVERSVSLAAGMEARGFARTRQGQRRGTLPLMLACVLLALLGVFGLLATAWPGPSLAVGAAGVTGTVWGLRQAGLRLRVTRYRPDPWRWRDTAIAGCGALALAASAALTALAPGVLNPSTSPLAWPALTAPMLVVPLLGLAALPLTGRPRTSPAASQRRGTAAHPSRRSLRPRPDRDLVDA